MDAPARPKAPRSGGPPNLGPLRTPACPGSGPAAPFELTFSTIVSFPRGFSLLLLFFSPLIFSILLTLNFGEGNLRWDGGGEKQKEEPLAPREVHKGDKGPPRSRRPGVQDGGGGPAATGYVYRGRADVGGDGHIHPPDRLHRGVIYHCHRRKRAKLIGKYLMGTCWGRGRTAR